MKKIVTMVSIVLTLFCFSLYTSYAYPIVESTQKMLSFVRNSTKDVVILNIFASFCTACKQEVGVLNRIQSNFKDTTILYGISLDEYKEPLDAFIKETKMAYPVSIMLHTVAQELGIEIIPQIFIYKKGILVKHIIGLASYEELVRYIQQ